MPIKVWATPIRWREGFLVLNGAMVKADDFPALFAIFGHTFGGSGRTFRLPEGGDPVSETLASSDGTRAAFYHLPERVPDTFGHPRLAVINRPGGRGWIAQDFFRPPYCLESLGRAATSRVRQRSSCRGSSRSSSSAVGWRTE